MELFSLPLEYAFGKDALDRLNFFIKKYNYKNILILYGKGSCKVNGIFNKVILEIPKNVNYHEFGGIGQIL